MTLRKTMAMNKGFDYIDHIDQRGAGLTVLAYLALTYKHSSEGDWRARLVNGEVFLDGVKARPDDALKAGHCLLWRRPPWEEPDVPLDFALLYRDEDLLAVAKPGGLPTVPAGGFLEHTLLNLVRRHYPGSTPVHRLGRGTSGVVIFARTERARSGLCAALRQNKVTKAYRALATGIPREDLFSIEARIGPVPHPRLGTVHAASAAGKAAVSRVRVLERRYETSLLSILIETGKPHQIRIHLAVAGYPLVADPLFTIGGELRDGGAALPGDGGYLLHAERVCLAHPTRGSQLEIYCSPPPQLRAGFSEE